MHAPSSISPRTQMTHSTLALIVRGASHNTRGGTRGANEGAHSGLQIAESVGCVMLY